MLDVSVRERETNGSCSFRVRILSLLWSHGSDLIRGLRMRRLEVDETRSTNVVMEGGVCE